MALQLRHLLLLGCCLGPIACSSHQHADVESHQHVDVESLRGPLAQVVQTNHLDRYHSWPMMNLPPGEDQGTTYFLDHGNLFLWFYGDPPTVRRAEFWPASDSAEERFQKANAGWDAYVKTHTQKAPATTWSSRRVGEVYGKPVTEADIGLSGPIDPAVRFDARDTARWALMGRIATTFGKPITDRFVEQRKIDATPDEIQTFKRRLHQASETSAREMEDRLAYIKEKLAAPNLSDKDKATLQERQAMLERSAPAMRYSSKSDVPDDMARMFIIAWKTERDLHRVYGGRVIFQQAGAEALDARRLLYEEAEKKDDLKFDDAGVRHLFYYYANMQHTATDETALERPWFLDEAR